MSEKMHSVLKQSENHNTAEHGSTKSYIVGFILSLMLTFAAYFLVTGQILDRGLLIAVLLTLGLIQLIVQLFFFLHLGQEKKPRWNLVFFLLTTMTILTVVIGALWIMEHLNYNMMPEHVEEYIIQDEGLKTPDQN
jgi:cytochrome o ubiquinol oxidase subunit IV